MRKKSPSTERFDPNDIPLLLEKAKAGDIESRDRLLYMFQRMVVTLVNVCITGRVNWFSSYQKTFLRYFGTKDTPLETIAVALKQKLSGIDKEELYTLGQIAVLEAIIKCETNLASTIVLCFKDAITDLTKGGCLQSYVDLDDCQSIHEFEKETIFNLWIQSLELNEQLIVDSILSGEDVPKSTIPSTLKQKLREYMSN